jgi:hypothetical protein
MRPTCLLLASALLFASAIAHAQNPPPLPVIENTPPAAVAAPLACPDGQAIGPDTGGHCCWPGQAWNGTRCIGIPTSCPPGWSPDAQNQACAVTPCPAGQSRVDAVHCCWPDQVFAASRNQCVGVPRCPAGFQVAGEACVGADGTPVATGTPPTGTPQPAAPGSPAAPAGDSKVAASGGDDSFLTIMLIVGGVAAVVGGTFLILMLTGALD